MPIGLQLIAERGRLMQSLADDGGMLTVFADEAAVGAAIAPDAPDISIAALNAPSSVVISGPRTALARAAARLGASGLQTRDLCASRAFHSRLMDPILGAFQSAAAKVRFSEPRIPIVSNVTGEFVRPGEMTNAAYWARHSRETVRFRPGLDTLTAAGHRVFLEIGPSPTLVALGVRCLPSDHVWLPSIRKDRDDVAEIANSLAALCANGVRVNWAEVYRDSPRRKVALPTYPFERERYWHEATPAPPALDAAARWARMVEAGERESNVGPLDLRLETYEARSAALDRVTVEHMLLALRTLRAFDAGEALTVDELMARCGIAAVYRHLLGRWLVRLAAEGLVSLRPDGRYVTRGGLRAPLLDDAWQQARTLNSGTPELLEYLERCGRLLVPVLTGAESALETVFPGGDFATAEFLYERWALTRYFNGIARAIAGAFVSGAPQGRPLRVVELGAGTGGMTSALLPVLPREGLTYDFTDLSAMFLARAEQKFGAFPGLRYGLLNIDQPPSAQGYPEGGFDLVVAANSVHATRDLRASLANIRSLLAPGGILLLYEVTSHMPWFEMSVGLIEGWERFADDIRGEDPLLKPEQWIRVLKETGFQAVHSLPGPGAAAEVLGHHIVIAQLPGRPGRHVDIEPRSRKSGAAVPAATPAAPPLIEQLQAASGEERTELLVRHAREHIAQVLRLPNGKTIDRRQRLMDLGIDSLMAVELRNRLGQGLDLKRPLAATLIFDYPTIEAIAKFLERECAKDGGGVSEPVRPTSRAREIAGLSEEEVEHMLLRKLGGEKG